MNSIMSLSLAPMNPHTVVVAMGCRFLNLVGYLSEQVITQTTSTTTIHNTTKTTIMSIPPPPPPTPLLPLWDRRQRVWRLSRWTQEAGSDLCDDSEPFLDIGTGAPLYATYFRLEQFVREKKHNPTLPPILYRVTNDRSMGINNEEEGFKSRHMKITGQAMDLESMEGEEIQRIALIHIRNVQHFRGQAFQSPWISFSCSLLATLQRAMWQVKRGYSNVTITTVDTSTLISNELICTATELATYVKSIEDRRFIEYDCHEEYLVFNQLQGQCSRVPFLRLYGDGINVLLPELNASNVHTFLSVGLARLRTAAFNNEYPLSTTEIDRCARLTNHLFTGQRRMLVFFALLALRRRPARDPAIVTYAWEKMKEWRTGAAYDSKGSVRLENLFYLHWGWNFSRVDASQHMEIKQFANIGAELTMLAKAYEEEITAAVMKTFWFEYDWIMDQMARKLGGDTRLRQLYQALERNRLAYRKHTLLMLKGDAKAKERVVSGLRVARKWLCEAKM